MGAGLLVKRLHQPEIGSFFEAVALAIKGKNAIRGSFASKDTPVQKLEREHVRQAGRQAEGKMDSGCPLREGCQHG